MGIAPDMGIFFGEGFFGLRIMRRGDETVVYEKTFDEPTTAIAMLLRGQMDALCSPDEAYYFYKREAFVTTHDAPAKSGVGYSWIGVAAEQFRCELDTFIGGASVREAKAGSRAAEAEALRARRAHCGIEPYRAAGRGPA